MYKQMKINKCIEIALNVNDVIGLCTDIENKLFNILVERFQGKCIRQCFVLEINKIIKYGDCVVNQDGPPNFGVINVIFEVLAIVYTPGEIINGCNVISRETSDIILCSTENTDIVLNYNPILSSVQIDQKISLRVYKTKYTVGQNKISVSAVPLIPSKTPVLYKYIPSEIPTDFALYVKDISEKIAIVNAELDKMRTTANYKFFETLYYGFPSLMKLPESAKTIDIFKFVEQLPNKQCFVTRDPRLLPSTNDVVTYDDPNNAGENVKIINDIKSEIIIATLLDEYYNNIRTILECINIYHTQELINSHKNLWLLYGSIKK